MTVIFVAAMIFSTSSIKTIEKCLNIALTGHEEKYLQLSDYNDVREAMRDYPLLPEELKTAFDDCIKSLSDAKELCEEAYGKGKCELWGMAYVPHCEPGFVRIDATVCAKECPNESQSSESKICYLIERKVIQRKTYNSLVLCEAEHSKCEDHGKFAVEACAEHYRPLNKFMCVYECPAGFKESDKFCFPEMKVNNEYFLTNLGKI